MTKRQELNKALHEIESIEKRLRAMADPMELGDGRFSTLMADYYVDHGRLPRPSWGKRVWSAVSKKFDIWAERTTKGKRLTETINDMSRTIKDQRSDISRWRQDCQRLGAELNRLTAQQKQENHTPPVLGFVHGLSPLFLNDDAPAVPIRQG